MRLDMRVGAVAAEPQGSEWTGSGFGGQGRRQPEHELGAELQRATDPAAAPGPQRDSEQRANPQLAARRQVDQPV